MVFEACDIQSFIFAVLDHEHESAVLKHLLKPYGFVGFRIPNLHFCYAVSKKHKDQGLITDWRWSEALSLPGPLRKA